MRDGGNAAKAAREKMVEEQIAARGIIDTRVLAAMRKVPREGFIDGPLARAYEDRPLSIGYGQTISQPYIVAKVAELARLRGGEQVLEVGAGCGYQSAVLAELAAQVWAIEIIPDLATLARRKLAALGIGNVHVDCFDGTFGWPAHAPYDAIVVSAGAPNIPVLLVSQLHDGGRLVAPVGPRDDQRLVVVTRRGDDFETRDDIPVRFVDLTGRYGWGGSGPPQA